jgi:predicted transcriptional regulator
MVNREQIRAARAWLGITQQELADAALIDKKTIARFELGLSVPHDRTLRDMRLALEARGIEFLFDDQIGVGIRLEARSKLKRG